MIILPEDREIVAQLPDDDLRMFMLAIFSDDENIPELTPLARMAYTVVKNKSERLSARQSVNGKNGGAPKGNQNAKKQPKTTQTSQAHEKQPKQASGTVSDTVTESVPELKSGAAAPAAGEKSVVMPASTSAAHVPAGEVPEARKSAAGGKHRRGQYGWVMLTDAEYGHLTGEFGNTALHYIAVVDELAQQTGNKNKWKDWNLTVRKAIREKWGSRAPPSAAGGQNRFVNFKQRDNDYHAFDQMERERRVLEAEKLSPRLHAGKV